MTHPILGAFPLQTYKQRSIWDPKSDFRCTRIETTAPSLGLKCKQKHDLLLGVSYPFKKIVKIIFNQNAYVSCRDEMSVMAVLTFTYQMKDKSFPNKMTTTI